MKVLIVDDDAQHGESVKQLLIASDFPSAHMATSGTEGLARLSEAFRSGAGYDVLILDLHIPDLSGVEILQAINEQQLRVKTIVLSGEQELDSVTPILKLGASDFIRKPFLAQELISAINNAYARHTLEQENALMHRQASERAKLYEFLLNAAPDLVYMLDAQGRFRFINKRLNRIFDADLNHLDGQPWQHLFSERDELIEVLQHHFNERRTGLRATVASEFDYESSVRTRHTLELSSIGLYNRDRDEPEFMGTYGIVRDVTDARRTASQLQQSQQKFYSLFAESPDAVFISRIEDGEIIEGNQNFYRISATLRQGQANHDAFLWNAGQPRDQFIQELKNQPNVEWQLQHTVDGDKLFFEIRGRRLVIEGVPCLLATLRDRTQERNAAQDRLMLEQQLQQAGRMEAIGQIAGGIAHDFNNILASIIGYAELILNVRTRLPAEQVDQYLEQVVTAGHRARDLISQMLSFTRAQMGEVASVDVTSTIEEVSRMLSAAIPSTITLQTESEPDLPETFVDPIQIQQIIINLLINARDAIDGTGRIDVRVRKSTASAVCHTCGKHTGTDPVVIEVQDSGHGIEPAIRERIFEMYFTTREPGQGTGLGLWLINKLVHQHEGHITLTSEPGSGTTFQIYLPTTKVEPAEPVSPAAIPTPRIEGRIVVVDDEVSVANFIGEVLRDRGYPAVIFTDAPKARDYLDRHIDQVALLLTDGYMPAISGVELIDHVRSMRPEMPVIFISGYTAQLDAQTLKNKRVNATLEKPFGIDEMLSAVVEVTQEQAAHQA
ncbi:MAG: response regulator [Pseudomonadota bacterium]